MAATEAPILKAAVTEAGGEISCSVDETNRLRAILGMKPLNVGNAAVSEKEAAMKKEHMERLAKQAKQAQLAELEERLAKAKRQRELHEKLKGKSLGQSLSEETGMSSASSWVERSRLREVQEKLMAEKRAALLDEQEELDEEDEPEAYGAGALAGLAVAHGMQEFGQGQTILTLADKGVLDDDEDLLQNVNMADANRTTEMNEEKEKAAKPVYTGEDSTAFDPSLRNAGVGARILQQYDEKKKKATGMVLDGREHITAADLQLAEAVKARVAASKALRPGETLTDLSTTREKISDYYTPSETVAFKRPSKKRRKKKRKSSKKMSLADELERNPQVGADSRHKKERRSRKKAGSRNAEAAAAVQKKKDAHYRSALEKARAEAISRYDADEDDVFLQQSVSRARRWAKQQKEQAVDNAGGDEEQVARPIADVRAEKCVARAAKLREEEEVAKKQAAIDALDVDESDAPEHIVFTNTTEFTKRLAARMAGRRATKKEQTKKEAERALERKLDNEASKAKAMAKEALGDDGDDGAWATVRRSDDMDVDDEALPARKKTTATVTSEPLVSCGMASTLALLARSGELKNKMAFAGRSKDEQMETMKVSKNVTIEYKDEWGRLLTPKEAFRQLSYKFHGRKPGRKKQDKILRKLREDLHVNSGDMDDTPLGIMKAMKKKQMASQQAHVVLRGGEADRGGQIRKK